MTKIMLVTAVCAFPFLGGVFGWVGAPLPTHRSALKVPSHPLLKPLAAATLKSEWRESMGISNHLQQGETDYVFDYVKLRKLLLGALLQHDSSDEKKSPLATMTQKSEWRDSLGISNHIQRETYSPYYVFNEANWANWRKLMLKALLMLSPKSSSHHAVAVYKKLYDRLEWLESLGVDAHNLHADAAAEGSSTGKFLDKDIDWRQHDASLLIHPDEGITASFRAFIPGRSANPPKHDQQQKMESHGPTQKREWRESLGIENHGYAVPLLGMYQYFQEPEPDQGGCFPEKFHGALAAN